MRIRTRKTTRSSACARRRGCSATHTKSWLVGLYGGALMLFALAFAAAEAPMPALAGLLAAGAHMARQIVVLDIDDPDQCLRLFKSNNVVGWLIFLGLIGGGVWVALKPLSEACAGVRAFCARSIPLQSVAGR